MRSNNAQLSVILLAVVGTCALAFGVPLMLAGDRVERRDDIVIAPRHTATSTPMDRALTQQAFAQMFFTPTHTPRVAPVGTASPSFTLTLTPAPTIIVVVSGTAISITDTPPFLIPQTGGFPPFPTASTSRPEADPPTPTRTFTPTPSRTLTPSPTRTLTPTNSFTPSATFTPTVTRTLTPTHTVTPSQTNTFIPTPVPPTNTFTPSPTPLPPTATDPPLPTATDPPATDPPPPTDESPSP